MEQVILVDENDNPVGLAEKMDAHKKGLLHRAFSVFIFNSKGEMMLQQRALGKYHSGGLWTNACCSHPASGEEITDTIYRRLKEEMGFATAVGKIFHFIYRAEFDNGLTEYEVDHVFAGEYDGLVNFNRDEVMDYCYKDMESIGQSLKDHPEKYTVWFSLAFPKISAWWNQQYNHKVG